jgi:GNAT superfamily N-acetyltransferase
MSPVLRRAVQADGLVLARHCAELMTTASLERVTGDVRSWAPHFAGMVVEGRYVAVVAELDGAVVGSAAYVVRQTLPRPWSEPGSEGRVVDMFVAPEARGNGIATAMLRELIGWARTAELRRLTLWPAHEARQIYSDAGFVPLDEMALRLDMRP